MRLCENVKKYVYNPKFIHNDNNENTRKTINPPSYPHCPQKKCINLSVKIKTYVLVNVTKTQKKKRKYRKNY